jgi:hypothetical protein
VHVSALQNDPSYFFLKSDLIPSLVSVTPIYNDIIFSNPLDDDITEFDGKCSLYNVVLHKHTCIHSFPFINCQEIFSRVASSWFNHQLIT